jgi:hypothetical protein
LDPAKDGQERVWLALDNDGRIKKRDHTAAGSVVENTPTRRSSVAGWDYLRAIFGKFALLLAALFGH